MDMSTFAVIATGIACAFSAYMLWQSKRDGLSFIDEIKRQLDSHKTSTVNAAVKAVQAATAVPAPVQATPVAIPPVAPAVEPPSGSGLVINPTGTGFAISQPITITNGGGLFPADKPKETPMRDEMTEGPKIAEWLSANHPDMMSKVSRVIHWWAINPLYDYATAAAAVAADHDLTGQNLINAIGQQHRDEAAHVEGDLYNGPYPVGSVSLTDMYYLLGMKPRYAAMTGRNVLIDVLYGSADKVNELINDAGSTHAAETAQYDIGTYQGPLRPIVESRMNGR